MNRAKTFDATGIAPGGRLYAGDLNLIQDLVAALLDLTQNLSVGTLAVGEAGLLISRYGAGEFQFAGLARFSGIMRMLNGFVGGTYTTAARNAIPAGSRPYGLVILNSTTNQYEWNSGTDPVPVWQGISPTIGAGSIGNTELAADAVTGAKIAPGHGGADDYGTAFPSTGLFNGYRFTLFSSYVNDSSVSGKFIYRADLDATWPWHYEGGQDAHHAAAMAAPGGNVATFGDGASLTVPRSGVYSVIGSGTIATGVGGADVRLLVAGVDVAGHNSPGNVMGLCVTWQGSITGGAVAKMQGGVGGGATTGPSDLLIRPKKLA